MPSFIGAMNAIRDVLRSSSLADPRVLAGSTKSRVWVFTDDPRLDSSFPRVTLEKANNPTNNIEIGNTTNVEQEFAFINIYFRTKHDFKITVSDVVFKNEQLVEHYLGLIKDALKANFSTLHDAGYGGFRAINTNTKPDYDPETQTHFGVATVRVWYFIR